MINITEPFLPPLEEYNNYLKDIWDRNWLTNNGPILNQFELEIKKYLDVKHFIFVNNGTSALQLAIKTLELEGEIITTPFTYIATSNSILWEGCTPVFADIKPDTFNIDPEKIKEKITKKTTAILATHVFGNPCDIEIIQSIAKENSLKVIYDASHCFGVKIAGSSILDKGDISTLSFHATKVYHTIEGGGIITKNSDYIKKISLLRNFGHNGVDNFEGVGINCKNSEFHSAMGLVNLKYIDKVIDKRKVDSSIYDNYLKIDQLQKQKISPETDYNYSYYPILFENEKVCLKVYNALKNVKINPRRYFYPSLSTLNHINPNKMEVSENVASRILCLPLYYTLTREEISMICRIILRTLKY